MVGAGDFDVHSYHHQGIDRLGDGLVVTATSDGLVQAFESDGDGYVVGVQWHPEENAEDKRLFAGLVAQASAYAVSRMETTS
jgi:putative glutamine amidotransferase